MLAMLGAPVLQAQGLTGQATAQATSVDSAQLGELAYTVRPGDTLLAICAKQPAPCDWRAVKERNRVLNPNLLIPGQVLWLPAQADKPEPANLPLTAEVVQRHGSVSVVRAVSSKVEPLIDGMQLSQGDLIRTGPASSAALRLPDGSRLVLHANSQLDITRHWLRANDGVQETQLRLRQGSMDTQVAPPAAGQPKPELNIRTPVANLGVRGTQWRTRIEQTITQVEVLSGGVQVQAANADGADGADAANDVVSPFSPSRAASRAKPGDSHGVKPLAPGPEAAPVLLSGGYGLSASPAGLGEVQSLPLAPAVTGLPQNLESWPAHFVLSNTAPASAWRARIVAAGQPEQVLLDQRFATPTLDWSLAAFAMDGQGAATSDGVAAGAAAQARGLPDGRYWLLIRAISASGLQGPDAQHAFVIQRRPQAPLLVGPLQDQALIAGIQALQWRMADTLDSRISVCRVQVASDAQFTDLLSDRRSSHTGGEMGQMLLNLPPGAYHWRVACAHWSEEISPAGERALGPQSPWSAGRFSVRP